MEQQLFVIGIILALVVIILALEMWNRVQLRKRVRNEWGRPPRQARFGDKEESLKAAWQLMKKAQPTDAEIDDLTWYDLKMWEVFQQINATYSSVGSEALYYRLRNYDFSSKQLTRLEQLMSYYSQHPQVREELHYQFARLGKKDNNYVQDYLMNSEHRKLGQLPFYILCGCLPIVGILLLVLGQMVGIFVLLASVLFNAVYYQTKKARLERELASMGYLVQTVAAAKRISKRQTPFQAELQQNLRPIQSITKFAFSFQAKTGTDMEWVMDYLNMIFMLPFISYHFVLSKIQHHQSEAYALWQLLGELEVGIAVLNYRQFMPDWSQPTFTEAMTMQGTEAYHPLVSEAVANPVLWRRNTLVTGSNASGKSTYVKSVAINALLAQTINTALCLELQLPHSQILTSMAIEDDVLAGDSYFIAEIKSLKRILTALAKGKPCLCFIDEILKGTNTIERIAASAAFIDDLKTQPVLAFVATHDIELTEILKHSCDNVHFEEQVDDAGVHFDYLLKEGPATSRNAIRLLEVLQFPKAMTDKATAEAEDFENQKQWRVFP